MGVGGREDGSFLQAQSPRLSRFYLGLPHLPFLRRPPLHNSLPGKRNRKQEGGVSEGKGGAVLHPLTQPNPWGHGGGARLWSQALHPLETRIAEEGPHKSEIHYCFYSPGAAGDRDPTFTTNRAVNRDILSCITPWEITPIWGASTPKPSQLGTGMRARGGGGRGELLKPGRPSALTPAVRPAYSHCLAWAPRPGAAPARPLGPL